ncbi:Na+/H+ antiporter NhaC [Maridesulfovibrio salexigens]|uniref:Na+/H+ antiporter NhaC n=1 Tax=Maridesulfovibrio salexigens (strain ATCC 14822 / DSM 2638 / NCIMB 8403 / VKM B-1763) TaxID=526222 RepID=C6BRI1_MARSD|nr:Na+/H+ antiporter NhaC [Maridesulfovibrio salexigens]ACS79421.1 Na+/H+ antiporter NhaC [Maridesulfovibrio salexigens DSM 2638]
MSSENRKPSLLWAFLTFAIPVAIILYGTVVIGVRPPVLPLLVAVAAAGIMALKIGYSWNELQEGMLSAVGRIQLAVAILMLVGMIISSWMASGTIPAIIYWGLKLIAPEHFLLSTFILCSVASLATGTSFGTMGTIGVALLGVGGAMGFDPAWTVGAIVSGAYFGDKMSPVSDSTNITATVCEVPLFTHIGSMLWTTVPAALIAIVGYIVLGSMHTGDVTSMGNIDTILTSLEASFSLSPIAFLPPVLMIVLAYKRLPVLPVMVICVVSALGIAMLEGATLSTLAKQLTSGYKAATPSPELNKLLSRGGLMSIMVTILLLTSGMAFGGILEKARVLEVLMDAMLRGARSAVSLVGATLGAAYIILLGTGSQILAVVVPGRAFGENYKKAGIAPQVLSRTCEDAGTLGCPLVPWSVHAFYILGVLGVSAVDYVPYAFFNVIIPVISLACAATGIGIIRTDGKSSRSLETATDPKSD